MESCVCTRNEPRSSFSVASRQYESIIKGPTHAPSAQPWKQLSVALHTQTPLRSTYEPPELGPCVPPHCPTAVVVGGSARPLARYLGTWLALPNLSRWLLRTIRLSYAIQFTRLPPKFRGIHFTSVKAADALVLRAEFAVLLAKDAIEPVPPAAMKMGFYSPYFIAPKKGDGLRWILDLRVLHRALHKLPSMPQTIPSVHIWRASISVQGPAIRAVPVAPCLHECGIDQVQVTPACCQTFSPW